MAIGDLVQTHLEQYGTINDKIYDTYFQELNNVEDDEKSISKDIDEMNN